VGKSTVMYQTARHLLHSGVPAKRLWWLRVDHPLLLPVPLGDLVRMVVDQSRATTESPLYLFIDELTYARDWDRWLKTFHDERWPVRVVATSSAVSALHGGHKESGIGRWEEQPLLPMTFCEFLDLLGSPSNRRAEETLSDTIGTMIDSPPDLDGLSFLRRRYIFTGGFPELLLAFKAGGADDEASRLLESQRTLRSEAIEKAVYKDIPQSFPIESPLVLERLLYVLASQIGGVLSPTKICQELESLTQPTFDKYVSFLEQAFLVFTLANYSDNESTVQKRGRKLYFVDAAVRNAALQRGLSPLSSPSEYGALTENLVGSHLYSLAKVSGSRLYHWRKGTHEVDFVLDQPNSPMALEVTSSSRHALRGLVEFASTHKRFRGRTYLASGAPGSMAPTKASDGVGRLPLDALLLAIGAQIERETYRRLGVSAGKRE